MGKRYLLDTNHLGPALNRVSHIRERYYQAHRSGLVLGTCVPALCELEAGIQLFHDVTGSRRAMKNLMGFVRIWPVDQAVARTYGELFNNLKRRGRVLSQVDIMLASLAKEMNLTLLTTDRDFEALPELTTENWIP